jgi:pyruvate formate lyase activating enzyme
MTITAPVFDLQRFSIHDGPGIRSLIFLKGCPLRCVWCQNPESQDARPRIAFYHDRCQDNLDCAAACPHSAIDPAGFRIDQDRCRTCGDCVQACAQGALKRIGEMMTPEQLMAQVRVDLPYFAQGGGITLTGGEPTLYPKFVARFLALCREEGIHSAIETAGRFEWTRWQPILRQLDLIYFDLKIFDPARHLTLVGEGLAQILDNARRLAEGRFPVEFRMPLVPGMTDDGQNIDSAIRFLRSLDQKRIHLLPYHNLGESKIAIIQGQQPRLGLSRHPSEQLEAIRQRFHGAGIQTV